MEKMKAKVVAFYLPQFHPIPENDKWWGPGFTEWTNVGKAEKLYPGHYQPRVPADLGYYDLRVPSVREAQAEMAREAGVAAFCYWHYWFGDGKQLLEKPLQEVVASGQPDFPFCLGWANHDWSKKNWNKDESRFNNEFLIRMSYPGREDVDRHFFTMLPMFRDRRYFQSHGRLLFYIHSVDKIPDFEYFVKRWRELAVQNGLPGFFFVAGVSSKEAIHSPNAALCEAVNLDLRATAFYSGHEAFWRRVSYLAPFPIFVRRYARAIRRYKDGIYREPRVYPTLLPNWDHSPRVGRSATILHGSTPELFRRHADDIIGLVSGKEPEDRLIFLKSWNEWAEGNYMEPDLKFGKGYIRALAQALEEGR
jgi:hypothetical protein